MIMVLGPTRRRTARRDTRRCHQVCRISRQVPVFPANSSLAILAPKLKVRCENVNVRK